MPAISGSSPPSRAKAGAASGRPGRDERASRRPCRTIRAARPPRPAAGLPPVDAHQEHPHRIGQRRRPLGGPVHPVAPLRRAEMGEPGAADQQMRRIGMVDRRAAGDCRRRRGDVDALARHDRQLGEAGARGNCRGRKLDGRMRLRRRRALPPSRQRRHARAPFSTELDERAISTGHRSLSDCRAACPSSARSAGTSSRAFEDRAGVELAGQRRAGSPATASATRGRHSRPRLELAAPARRQFRSGRAACYRCPAAGRCAPGRRCVSKARPPPPPPRARR